jgi:peptidoglycan/xylan/chitin deacetylase (PgdA/CDA1 family)
MAAAQRRFQRIPDLVWPQGIRCAVNVTLDYDAQLARRANNEPRMELTEGEFGGRTGIWRLMDLCSAHDVGLTLFVPGRICELYPESLRDAARRGFEVASHMWEHRVPAEPELQREHLRRTTAALEATTGVRPVGQRARGWDFDSLAAEGYRYISSFTADDKPYYMHEGGHTMLNLPFQWALDDAAYFKFAWLRGVPAAQRISDPDSVFENWSAAFRRIHAMGGYMNITVHDLQSGRAARVAMLERLFTEMKRHEGVWFPTCERVVRHCLEHYPAHRTEEV